MNQIPSSPAEARAFLQAHYGRPEAASITPRQRVAAALRHEEPDRVPFDFWAVSEVWAALRCYLDTDDDGDVLRLLGIDCRWVRPDYVGPAPIVQEDGSYYDAFGTHRRPMSNEFCTYEEYAGHTDVTKGDPSNGERMAFVFDTRKVHLSGLASELVVPQEQFDRIAPDALERQFARTPYAVSFRSGRKTFILVTLHAIYGKKADERIPELKAIAEWLAEWARDINAWDHNLIALGDFNIDRSGDKLYDAFTSTGLHIPGDLQSPPDDL